ncbi:MAG: Arm DNA-binding domain-containing protein, partial [Mucinivorans sp.]
MATIKTYLDERRAKSDGTYPLKLNINIENRGKILISTKLSLHPKNWENNTIIGRKDKDVMLSRLRLYLGRIDDELLKMERTGEINTLPLPDIKKRLDAVRVGASVATEEVHDYLVKDHFEYFMRFKERSNTKEVYGQTLKKIAQVSNL